MYVTEPKKYTYGRRSKRLSRMQIRQTAVIVALISISILISIMIPAYMIRSYF
jgi:hypothetical protein